MRMLDRKLVRDLRSHWGQVAAIVAVLACGVATYISQASAHHNLLLTRDAYYAQYRLADVFIMLERAPETAVRRFEALEGVRRARGRIVKDVNLDLPGEEEPRSGRLISLPDDPGPTLNGICLTSGRYFSGVDPNEVILSTSFAKANKLRPGDRLRASVNNKQHTLRVVGTAQSPEYIYTIRSPAELVPSPERFGILYVPDTFAEGALDMRDACNDIVALLDGAVAPDVVLDRARKLLAPYGVYATVKRADQMSNRFISDEITGLAVSARITPAIFLGIASLIILVLLNRMVTRERTEIGLLKAYGYTNARVALHYMKIAFAMGILGCLAGAVLGQLLADAMLRLYVEFYQFPLLRGRAYPGVFARALAISLVATGVGALSAAHKAATLRPAESMRPVAPRAGHRTLLERWGGLWRRLSPGDRLLVRTVSRYRLRTTVNVVGVAVSVAVMVTGFFMGDTMHYMIEYQFTQTQREDVRVRLATEQRKAALYDLARLPGVRGAEPLLEYPFEARHGWRRKELVIVGLPPEGSLQRVHDSAGRRIVPRGPGLYLSDILARQLGAGPGSVVQLKPLMGKVTRQVDVPVRAVVEQYLGASAYMDIATLSRLLDEPYALNSVLLRTEQGAERGIAPELKDVPGVASVEVKADAVAGIRNTLERSMAISNVFMAVFAGVIAFGIIYNTTMVSLAERERELASMRVLGFTLREVAAMVYKENTMLTVAGLVLGLPLGTALSRVLTSVYDTDLYRLPYHIEPGTFLRAAGLAVVFTALANLSVWRRMRGLDLVAVLKARD